MLYSISPCRVPGCHIIAFKRIKPLHHLQAQLKAENIEVCSDPVPAHGLWKWNEAFLETPSDQHLSRCPINLLGNAHHRFVFELLGLDKW